MTEASEPRAEGAPDPRVPFRRTTLWLLGGLVLASLVAMFALFAFDDLGGSDSTGSNAYSRSALGHHGLVALLEERGVPVIVSRANSGARAARGLLVVAEPRVGDPAADQRLTDLVASAPRVLLVLPKWWGTASAQRRGWLAEVALLPEAEVRDALTPIGFAAEGFGRAEAPLRVAAARIEHRPQSVPAAVDAPGRRDLLAEAGRAFIVEVEVETADGGEGVLVIVTDPDLINNHGLDEPGNAATALALIDDLRAGGPVVFDEVSHGYARAPGLWGHLLRYPLVLATLSAALAALALGLASRGRFGPPTAPPPPVAAGKDFLIAHTANLLRHGGHDAAMLRRYLTVAVQRVRAAAHAPRELTGPALVAWLERIGAARAVTIPLAALEAEVAALEADRSLHRRAPAIAARIHRWREEMTRGSGNHS